MPRLHTRAALEQILQELTCLAAAGAATGDGVVKKPTAPDRRSPPHWCATGDSVVGDARLRWGPQVSSPCALTCERRGAELRLQTRTALEQILQQLTKLNAAGAATGDEVEKKHAALDRSSPPHWRLTGGSLVGDVRLGWDPQVSLPSALA